MYNFLLLAAEILPETDETISYEPALFKMIVTFFALIALIIGTVWLLKKMLGASYKFSSSQRSIEILEKKGLSPKSTLYIVKVLGKKVAFVESQAEIKKIAEEGHPLTSEDR